MTQKWLLEPGVNVSLFNALKLKTLRMADEARDCVLTMDEMSIKCNLYYDIGRDEVVGLEQYNSEKTSLIANNVMVLMARGIFINWKQPLAYIFVNTTCKEEYLKKNCI